MDMSSMCEAMKAAMPQISLDGLTGVGMTWDASGVSAVKASAETISNGWFAASATNFS